MLEASLDEADYEDKVWLGLQERSSDNRDSSSRKQIKKAEEDHSVPFTSLIMNMRNQLYPDPFDEFDPHHRVSGKKAFTNVVRCLQSKINLRFPIEENTQKTTKNREITVKKEFIEEFDRKYTEMCDNKKMNIKQRGISMDNPFEKQNKPPIEHLLPNKILEKPGYIKNLKELKDEKPLAGRFSEIGERIFSLGNKKAAQLCTGPWGEISMLDGIPRKKVKPFPENPTLKSFEQGENHFKLHKTYVPPAYMTNPAIAYTGKSKE